MAVGKEIKTQIKSVQNTQKITSAMEMVAASKMRKAQSRMDSSRPYADKIKQVIGHLAGAHPEYRHPFMVARPVKTIGLIVVSSDRGLCGGLNNNLFRVLLKQMQAWDEAGIKLKISVFGSKAAAFFRRVGGDIQAETTALGDQPAFNDLLGGVTVMTQSFEAGDIDALYLASNRYVNTMTQAPTVEQLVPIEQSSEEADASQGQWDYLYEPEAQDVLDALLLRYIEALIYQGVVENIACEQSARMVAMKSASDNAGELIGELQLVYNKARQAAITQEISEIVSGASAI